MAFSETDLKPFVRGCSNLPGEPHPYSAFWRFRSHCWRIVGSFLLATCLPVTRDRSVPEPLKLEISGQVFRHSVEQLARSSRLGVCDSRTGNLAVRFGPLHRSNARGVAVNQLPTAIPFHPDVCVSETDMSPFAL